MDVNIFVVAVDVEQGNGIKDGFLFLHGRHFVHFCSATIAIATNVAVATRIFVVLLL